MSGRTVVMSLLMSMASAVAVAGCFTTTADYRAEAETFIVEDDEIVTSLGVAMNSATCEEPPDQDPGTTFECTAVDVDGGEWGFEVEIQEDNEFRVSVTDRP